LAGRRRAASGGEQYDHHGRNSAGTGSSDSDGDESWGAKRKFGGRFTYVVPTSTTITYVQVTRHAANRFDHGKYRLHGRSGCGRPQRHRGGWNDSKAVVSAVTDSKGNKYHWPWAPRPERLRDAVHLLCEEHRSGGCRGKHVTVTFASAATAPDIRILEYSGADPSNPVDVTVATTGSSATSSSGAVTTTNANDLLFGANLFRPAPPLRAAASPNGC